MDRVEASTSLASGRDFDLSSDQWHHIRLALQSKELSSPLGVGVPAALSIRCASSLSSYHCNVCIQDGNTCTWDVSFWYRSMILVRSVPELWREATAKNELEVMVTCASSLGVNPGAL